MDAKVIKKFEASIMPEPMSGCWLWTESLNYGYGFISIKRQPIGAHRISYTIYKGPIPKGLLVCHTCDVRSCVNPDHLFLGTIRDNIQDMHKKGRADKRHGELNAVAKLTNAQVIEIVEKHAKGKTKRQLSDEYSVNETTIYRIVSGNGWKKVTGL